MPKDELTPLNAAIEAVGPLYADRLGEAEGAMPFVALVGEMLKSVLHYIREQQWEEPPATEVVWKVAQFVCGPQTTGES